MILTKNPTQYKVESDTESDRTVQVATYCLTPENRKYLRQKELAAKAASSLVEAPGIEPGSRRTRTPASTCVSSLHREAEPLMFADAAPARRVRHRLAGSVV